jgi:hypothetical protein
MTLGTAPGMHRFTWDVHYQPLDGVSRVGGPTLPIAAIGYNTVPEPTTPWVNPGTYTVKLTVNGKSYSQPIVVKQDPRVKTSALVMQQVYSLSKAMYDEAIAAQRAVELSRAIRDRLAKLQSQASGPAAEALAAFDKTVEALTGAQATPGGRGRGQGPGGGGGRGGPAPARADTLTAATAGLAAVMSSLQAADVQPTTMQLTTIAAARNAASRVMARWNVLRTTELAALNAKLKAAGLAAIQP